MSCKIRVVNLSEVEKNSVLKHFEYIGKYGIFLKIVPHTEQS